MDGTFKIASYFDTNGTLIKQVGSPFGGDSVVTLTNAANGKLETTHSQALTGLIIYNPDGSVVESDQGVTFNFVVPGSGTLFQVTGRIVFDSFGNVLFVTGPHTTIPPAMCAYVADP